MPAPRLLDPVLASAPAAITIALFSQRDCAFCEEVREHYLRPMLATLPRRITIAEFELVGTRRVANRTGRSLTEAEFARECKAKFAPTVMFLDAAGEALAPTIVGLSRDFFGAYLDQRIQIAFKAVG